MQLQATIYQINDGNPLDDSVAIAFSTDDILVSESAAGGSINSYIQVINGNRFFASETVSALIIASSNSLVGAQVLRIDGSLQTRAMAFPVSGCIIQAGDGTDGINATIAFNGSAYGVAETVETLVTAMNAGGGGGGGSETLDAVLANGNDANGRTITNVNIIQLVDEFSSLEMNGGSIGDAGTVSIVQGGSINMRSPNNAAWIITVANDGTLSITGD